MTESRSHSSGSSYDFMHNPDRQLTSWSLGCMSNLRFSSSCMLLDPPSGYCMKRGEQTKKWGRWDLNRTEWLVTLHMIHWLESLCMRDDHGALTLDELTKVLYLALAFSLCLSVLCTEQMNDCQRQHESSQLLHRHPWSTSNGLSNGSSCLRLWLQAR